MMQSGYRKLWIYVTGILYLSAIAKPCSYGEQQMMPDKKSSAIVLVAFGTTVKQAQKAFDNIEKLVKERFVDMPVYWAYTSSVVRKRLLKKGKKFLSVEQQLEQLAKRGVKKVVVQSLHIAKGDEFQKIVAAVTEHRKLFDKIEIGLPLLSTYNDLLDFVKRLTKSLEAQRQKDQAVVLMGHGNSKGVADFTYIATAYELQKSDKNVFLGTVEGVPSFDDVAKQLKASGLKKALLVPMMIVAGDHALNDLAGEEEDSWDSQLKKMNIKVESHLHGLGENDCVMEIFLKHLKVALETLRAK